MLLVDCCSCNSSSTSLYLPRLSAVNNFPKFARRRSFSNSLNSECLVSQSFLPWWYHGSPILACWLSTEVWDTMASYDVSTLNLNPSLLQSSSEISWSSNGRYVKASPYPLLVEYVESPLQLWHFSQTEICQNTTDCNSSPHNVVPRLLRYLATRSIL